MLRPTANPSKNIREGSQPFLIAKNPRIFDLLNIPPNPSPIEKITPVTNPITISSLSFFSRNRSNSRIKRDAARNIFAQTS